MEKVNKQIKKRKCELCGKGKARRKCGTQEKFICSICCAELRNSESCEECSYFKTAEEYNQAKSKKSAIKHFIAEVNPKVEEDVEKALALANRGKIEKSRGIIEELMKNYPENHTVYFGFGVIHAFEEEYDMAIRYFNRAINIFPYFVEAHFNKALAYHRKLDIKNTIQSFREVIEVGDHKDSLVRQAKSFICDLEKTLRKTDNISLEKYIEGQEIFDAAFSSMQEGKVEKAIAGFEECLKINARHVQSHGNLGICYAQLGQKEKALKALDKATEIDPTYEPAIMNKEAIESGDVIAPLDQITPIDYYKDYPHKKKSLIKSISDKIF